jgi:hypothetical protein
MAVFGRHPLDFHEVVLRTPFNPPGLFLDFYRGDFRPLIREPNLIGRWKSGDRRPASCLSDSGCFKPALEGRGVSCVVEARDRGLKGSLTKDLGR